MSEQMVVTPFVDDDVRTAIAESLDETLFVEAGAGTGKTSALVQRVMSLLRTGRAELHEIAAITFTEASALELRERIQQEIMQLIADGNDATWLVTARSQLDESAITTIHGFAMRILSEYSLEAGLPLRFRVLDQIASQVRFTSDSAVFLDQFFDDAIDRNLVAACVAIGITPTHLKFLLRAIHDEPRAAVSINTDGTSLSHDFFDQVHDLVMTTSRSFRAVAYMRSKCADEDDRLFKRLELCEKVAHEGESCMDWKDELSWLVSLTPQKVGNYGKAGNWNGEITSVRGALTDADANREDGVRFLVSSVLEALSGRLLLATKSWADQRRLDGEVNFSDLLVLARDMVVNDGHVRRALRSRYRRILVDEFQDTDPLQLEIMLALGRAEDSDQLERGRLFFVGDPRQSIYRFRGAQPEMYGPEFRGAFADRSVELTTNFRSVPGVLAFVNHTFGVLIDGGDDNDELDAADRQCSSAPTSLGGLSAAREAIDSFPSVTLLGGPGEHGSAGDRRSAEAGEIAATIARLIADGVTVVDQSVPAHQRPARFQDVAILVPRRTGLYELEDALDRYSVPYRLQSASLIYNAGEVRDLLSCLRAIAAPGDEPAVIAALRTAIFACGDDDLLEYRKSGGEWRLDSDPSPLIGDGRVAEALLYLRTLRDRGHGLGLYATVTALLQERHVFEIAIACRQPQEAVRRLEFVLEQIRAFADGGGVAMEELLTYLDLQQDLAMRVPDLPSIGDEQDAVHIMTIHGAKGLEFPIVIVSELGSTRSPQQGARVIRDDDGRIELRVSKDLETQGYSNLASIASKADRAERLRLLYVATTRARDYLIVSIFHQPAKSKNARSLAEILHGAAVAAPHLWHQGALSTDVAAKGVAIIHATPDSIGQGSQAWSSDLRDNADEKKTTPFIVDADHLEEIVCREQQFGEGLVVRTSIAASELAHLSDVVALPDDEKRSTVRQTALAKRSWRNEQADELASLSRRSQASAVGRAVHGVLQMMAFEDGENIDGLIGELARREQVLDQKETIADLVQAALHAPSVVEGLRMRSSYREFPITAVIDNRILEAVMDLCYEQNGEIVIVDYKTDAVKGPDEARAIADRYRLQAGAYGLAMTEVLGVKVARVVLVFLAMPTGAIEIEVTDLSGAMTDARAAMSEIVQPILPVAAELF